MNNHSKDPDRLQREASQEVLRLLEEKTLRDIRFYAAQPSAVIDDRIRELRQEWSIDRILQFEIATIGLTTALLALVHSRKWGILTCAVTATLLIFARTRKGSAVQLLRELGFRTRAEIDREIFALKLLRGDFASVKPLSPVGEEDVVLPVLQAVGISAPLG
ncbi:MAG: hypothetical protein QM790_07655 [Nibricoccus sp.]